MTRGRRFFLVAFIFSGVCPAAPLPVQQEQLGAWHYLVPVELAAADYPVARYPRAVYAPTAVTFGSRIAVILPGSSRVAEFRDGKFDDLNWPPLDLPLTLASDEDGTLACLFRPRAQPSDDFSKADACVAFLYPHAKRWTKALKVPLPNGNITHCDHIAFDTHHRFWAVGPCGTVAVLGAKGWDTFAYSDDLHMHFAPVRLGEANDGSVILFSDWEGEANISHMTGTLVYQGGRFTRQPQGDTSTLLAEQRSRDKAYGDDSAFQREKGYVVHALGDMRGSIDPPMTVLATNAYTLVALSFQGLAWTRNAELTALPPLTTDAEWETISDVVVPPSVDVDGNVWVARKNPGQVQRITAAKTETFPTPFPDRWQERMMLLDQLGRPWFVGGNTWLDSSPVVLYDAARGFEHGDTIVDLIKAHVADFKPGPLFRPVTTIGWGEGPGALKLRNGSVALGGQSFEQFALIDSSGAIQSFAPNQINPHQGDGGEGHGYNPFYDGDPQETAAGDVTTCVDGVVFRLHDGQWSQGDKFVPDGNKVFPNGSVQGDLLATQETAADGRVVLFRGFHFYQKLPSGLVQLDSGLNPLAAYPFWKGWMASPGGTEARIDPAGHLWINPLGYGRSRDNTETWMVLRKTLSPASQKTETAR